MLAAPSLRSGDTLGGFEVVRPLKSGGMGAVYIARETSSGELVALKVLGDTAAASSDRFAREARVIAALNHPHIVGCKGYGTTDDGVPWLAMDLLRGEDLETRLSRGPLGASEAVRIASQLCDALEHAHARTVVHRDLKPSNVFLCEGTSLHARVLDFGVARVDSERSLTRTGSPIGTPSYMSPEQARGDRDVDARADIWSLGVLLYECLSGRLPFQAGSVVGVLYQIVSAEPVELSVLAPELPRPLVELVHRALSKRREDRPASASAMRAALAALPSLDAIAPRPANSASRTATTLTQASNEGADEVRLSSVACLDGVRDHTLVADVARSLNGRVEPLANGATLVLFGVDRWSGDEPSRALRFARAVASACRSVGVATGRVLRSARCIEGEAVDAAAALTLRDGLSLDAHTASLARVTSPPDATAYALSDDVDARAPAAPFTGRAPELAALSRSVSSAVESLATRAVAVLGSAGIGKSRLRAEASVKVRADEVGARVVSVRCEALQRDVPFAALREALARELGASAAEAFSPSPAASRDPVAALDRAREALRDALTELSAKGPVVLSIDDAQWIDMSSRATIRWAREQPLDLPLAIWVFGRPEAHEAAVDLAGTGVTMELGPLDRADAARVLTAALGEAPAAILDRAGGHPLFLEELGRLAWAQGGAVDARLPPSVEGAHLAQLDLLASAEREFLKRAAVLGRAWWVEAVAHLGGEPETVRRLRSADLIAPRPRGRFSDAREFVFRTGVYQEVAYGLLPDAQRAKLHARAAEWLSERPDVAPHELARHWDLAGDRVRAALAYTAAAGAAAAVADAPTTCLHTARVLELTDDPELRWKALTARDDALQVSGDAALQRAGLTELEALAAGLTPSHEAEAAWRRCYALRVAGDVEGALAAGHHAAALAARTGDARRGALVGVELSLLLANAGRAAEARAQAEEARSLAARCDDAWLGARADAALAYVAADSADPASALALFDAAARGFSRVGDRRREALIRSNAAAVTLRLGRFEAAAAELATARDASLRVGNAQTAAVATHNLGVIRRLQGDLDGARSAQDRADSDATRLQFARLAGFVAVERLWIALVEGAARDLDALVAAAVVKAEATRFQPLIASAKATALRAAARGAGASRDAIEEARAMASKASPQAALELCLAVWEAAGRTEPDRVAAATALDRLVEGVTDEGDRAACRSTLARRFLIPSEIAGEMAT